MKTEVKNKWVIKNSGEHVQFSEIKLRRSLEKSGAKAKDIQYIIFEIKKILYPGITTNEIYKKAFSLLRDKGRSYAAKYKLKKALMELGPSGFPFEKYIAEVLSHEGYYTRVGEVLQGHCIQHEVDVVATKDNEYVVVECKFHSDSRRFCDVKVPLYINSRFLDLKERWERKSTNDEKNIQGWIVTNTRFSTDAIQYGNCVGIHLLSWGFPKKGSLKERIDRSGVHPITCMTSLTGKEKKLLLKKMIVLCKDIRNDESVLASIGIKGNRAKRVMAEATELYEIQILKV